MVILMALAALVGQPIATPGDAQLNLSIKGVERVETVAEKQCPSVFMGAAAGKSFLPNARLRQWMVAVGKQHGFTDDEQLVFMANCTLYSQGRLDEQRREKALNARRASRP